MYLLLIVLEHVTALQRGDWSTVKKRLVNCNRETGSTIEGRLELVCILVMYNICIMYTSSVHMHTAARFVHQQCKYVYQLCVYHASRHFGLYKESKLRETQCKGRYSSVKSIQLSWAGQYKKCVQSDFKFTSEYSGMQCLK